MKPVTSSLLDAFGADYEASAERRIATLALSKSELNSVAFSSKGANAMRQKFSVEVPALDFDELTEPSAGESSETIRARVNAARAVQRARYGDDTTATNAHMGPRALAQFCTLSPECEQLMHQAFDAMALTARSYDRILRVARTIADLNGAETIALTHLAEAIQYRTYDFSVAEP